MYCDQIQKERRKHFHDFITLFTLIFDLEVTLKLCTVTLTTIIHRTVQMVKNDERVCLKRPKKGEKMCQKVTFSPDDGLPTKQHPTPTPARVMDI